MFALIPINLSPCKLVLKGCKYAGLMNHEGRPWSYLYSALHIFLINTFGITCFCEILWGNGNLIDLIQTISTFMVYIQMNAKAVNILLNQRKIRHLLDRLENVRMEFLEDKEHKHFILEAEKFTRNCIKIFALVLLSFPFMSLIANWISDHTTNSEKPHLVFPVWLPWSMKEFWPYMAGTTFVGLIGLSTSFCYASFSTLEFTFTFQMSAFLKILQARLENNGPKDKMIYEHHKILMQLLQDYNELFSGQICIEILISSLQPCGSCYALIKILKNYDPGAMDSVHKLCMSTAAPFIICACGQELSTQMGKLHESSYMSTWYEEKPKIRKDLLTLMTVTVKPKTLNYRRFVTFDYVCFATVAQGVYSYLTMIINFDSDL